MFLAVDLLHPTWLIIVVVDLILSIERAFRNISSVNFCWNLVLPPFILCDLPARKFSRNYATIYDLLVFILYNQLIMVMAINAFWRSDIGLCRKFWWKKFKRGNFKNRTDKNVIFRLNLFVMYISYYKYGFRYYIPNSSQLFPLFSHYIPIKNNIKTITRELKS